MGKTKILTTAIGFILAFCFLSLKTEDLTLNTNVEAAEASLQTVTTHSMTSATTTTTTTTATTTTATKPMTTSKPTTTVSTTVKTTVPCAPKSVDNDELFMLSHLIYGEGGNTSDECQLAIGSVVLNRMSSSLFPSTMKDVIFAPGQYACTWDGNYDKTPDERAIRNAQYLLEHGSQIPSGVVFQAGFKQGEVYKIIDGVYFCYC